MPEPAKPDPATVAWTQIQQYCDRLFDAIERLEESGGISRAAEAAGWKPKTTEKARATLQATYDALGGQLARLKAMRKGGPGR